MEVQANKPQSLDQTDAIDLAGEVMDVESYTGMDVSEDVYARKCMYSWGNEGSWTVLASYEHSDDDVELDASFSSKILVCEIIVIRPDR